MPGMETFLMTMPLKQSGASINCMDGRVQAPATDHVRTRYGAIVGHYVVSPIFDTWPVRGRQ
jgi:hypothetical protein